MSFVVVAMSIEKYCIELQIVNYTYKLRCIVLVVCFVMATAIWVRNCANCILTSIIHLGSFRFRDV